MNDAPQPPAPSPAPPSIPAAQPAPTAPAAPKSGVGQKILAGCLVTLVVFGVLGGLAVWWGARKLRGIAENPATFAAKMIVAGNPELEVVSQDDGAKTVTIRNKKTGELLTMSADELEQGKIRFTNEKGEEITIDSSGGEGDGAISVKSKDGTMTIGADASVPAWVPAFPGAEPTGAYAQRSDDAEEGAFGFQTSEPVAKVLDFYQSQLEGKGYEVERTATEGEGGFGTGTLTGRSAAEHREVTIVVLSGGEDGKAAQVNVRYASREE